MAGRDQKKIIIRFIFLLFVIVAFGGIYYYNQSVNNQYSDSGQIVVPVQQKNLTKDFDASVLDTEKFQELKEIPLKAQTNVSSLTEAELTADELAKLKLMARYSNPFEPF
jgi:hypothetical protein